ncbi:hypothetical protein PESP_a0502 [Pseudoalteromonas espejiana DSM 9414]|uniref:Uncharacterized protein n=1 Tax=Pseudoalteromonas espejiana TaxID=28107 RepID=A0A510XXX2_9GAMM|nr:hypothetical protein [Pseudoalteromonas espejiana]ASM48744.1 hypothetical protein PESP_a0502 [Pseudoalteromonas espejiana DSM 9414]GEK55904.1 hypothetical protein PES01_27490 [Pseudoalteromonas espejiana]
MLCKQKSIPLFKAKLKAHPLLNKLIEKDVLKLSPSLCINKLPIQEAQTLLDLHPLLVSQIANDDTCFALVPCGLLERFKAHPLHTELNLKLLVYPKGAVELVSRSTLLCDPAFTYSLNANFNKNLQYRLKYFDEYGISRPKESLLTNLANTSSSTFR